VSRKEEFVRLNGVIRSAELQEDPSGNDRVEMVLVIQGVSPGQPRRVIVPFELLIGDESLDPDQVTGRRFEAEVAEEPQGRHVIQQIRLGARVLRPSDG
jgi:hypothetical protein